MALSIKVWSDQDQEGCEETVGHALVFTLTEGEDGSFRVANLEAITEEKLSRRLDIAVTAITEGIRYLEDNRGFFGLSVAIATLLEERIRKSAAFATTDWDNPIRA